jgi:general secretion pathway protein F
MTRMPRFQVRYIDASGAVREAAVDAPRAQAVAPALRVREADILASREIGAEAVAGRRSIGEAARSGPRHAQAFPLRTFCQELSVLIDSGIPLYDALQTLRDKESSPQVASVLQDIALSLSRGHTFAQALALRQDVFGALFVATVEASQGTGHIPQTLHRHAAYLGWLEGLRNRLVSAAIYPAILVVASLCVMAFLTIFVIPRFAEIYADIGGDLPTMSRWLLELGTAVGGHPVAVGLVAAMAVAASVSAWRTPSLRRALASRVWSLPHIGPRVRLMELAGFYRTLGMLLEAGVPMVPALDTCAGIMSPALRGGVAGTTRRVREGERLSDGIEAEGLATPVSLRMLRVGEQSGQLGPMLERAASFYDEELARFAEWIGRVINPALMLVMGVIIGGVVILMYMPIFQIADQIQ